MEAGHLQRSTDRRIFPQGWALALKPGDCYSQKAAPRGLRQVSPQVADKDSLCYS
jgi:hypothetical protein